jgi:1-acyl-sn-glycerol-3-phosphate acyltransferase
MDTYYSTVKLILRIYQRILSQNSHVSGDLPLRPGSKIIAANHPNATDAFYLPFVFQEKLHFFVQGDVFSVPFFGWLLSRCKQIPVWPAQKKAALEQACALLAGGQTVVIFPEGKLNPDRQPLKAGTGAVRLSLMTGAAIIPVGFYVPAQYLRNMIVQKKGRLRQGLWQTGGCCYIQIGCPWFPGQEMSGKVDEAAVRELTARLMERIEALVHLATLECVTENNLLLPVISSN